MRIVIDLQGAQSSGSRSRGIGRYSMSLAKAIVRNRCEHEIILALNGLFDDTIESIRAAFEGLLPQANIRVWLTPPDVSSVSNDHVTRRKAAELVREAFLSSLNPDMVLVTSLFEGFTDDAVTSIGKLSLTIPTSVILYDLIPLINHNPYLENPIVEAWYENKLDHLRRADLLLSISESSRQEGIRFLGFPPEKIINISTAADPQFIPQQVSNKIESELRQCYSLSRPFVMYTGGIDHRKNIEGLIRSYAKLSKSLRAKHQLAIVCSIQPDSRNALEALAQEQGLKDGELVLTGFVPEDHLVILYNLCKAFVFPSWHEGFGLPALEAMCCGRAVIGANTSSIPEVIGCEDALFDPRSDESITEKLVNVLSNDNFRLQLEQHGLKQSQHFSWDNSAKTAIAAIEKWHANQKSMRSSSLTGYRKKLAYVSPLPPERSGISDYSAELLPELARHYDIEVIIAQDFISDPWIKANCPIREIEWFKANANRYERIIYHFGNSHFHQHMFDLLAEIPGVVVLHDFFLSGIVAHMDFNRYKSGNWATELYRSHGYKALEHRYHAKELADVIWRYPANLGVLQDALGVIVHSENSRRLAAQWYENATAKDWALIPHLRVPDQGFQKNDARRLLKLNADDFVVCSFGLLSPTKLNHRLLNAWLNSTLAKNKKCVLVFVGENHNGEYGDNLVEIISRSGLKNQVRITGWADTANFRQYLAAADLGVQLRTLSRGETSGTVLDCMNYGLPTIVNANGSMADLSDDAVWKLVDEFEDEQLITALETLYRDSLHRERLGKKAKEIILTQHSPRVCSDRYAQAIEKMYCSSSTNINNLTHALAKIEPHSVDANEWIALADAIAACIPKRIECRQLLIDVSELVCRDGKTGIQRVTRAILHQLLSTPPVGYRVEIIYASPDHGYRYARQFALRFLGCPDTALTDEPVEYHAGDIFIGLDFRPEVVLRQTEFYQRLRKFGVQVHFVVYDLLPILQPHNFMPGASDWLNRWMQVVSNCDGAVCISKAVASNVSNWLEDNGPERLRPFNIGYFHLGADIDASIPTKGLPEDADLVLNNIKARPSFLMVGTLEPRKGHAQTLAAFDKLCDQGVAVNLVFVGKQGWMVENLVEKIRNHQQLNIQLFWLENISDEYLENIYEAATCLIAASEGEGFGLPLIEAAQHSLPLIVRDISVFREVAGDSAYYFSGLEAIDLANAVKDWLALNKTGKVPKSDAISWLTWEQSTQQFLEVVLNDKWLTYWMPDDRYRFQLGTDARLYTQVGKREGINIQTTGVAGNLIHGPYLPLPAGRHQVRIFGQVKHSGTPKAFADLTIKNGNEILILDVLPETPEVGLILEMEVYLETAVTSFEVRVCVSADSDLSITKLEVLPESLFDKQVDLLPYNSALDNFSQNEVVVFTNNSLPINKQTLQNQLSDSHR